MTTLVAAARPLLAGDPDIDVAIIGGGVVGCAIARDFTLAGARVVLLERGADLLSGASKGNTALLHREFDAPPGSLELQCIRRGRERFNAIRESLNLPVLETDGYLVAWNEAEQARLPEIVALAQRNLATDVVALDRDTLRARVPALAPTALGGIWVPGENVIDPWSTPLAYARQALANGAFIERRAEVRAATLTPRGWCLETVRGSVRAEVVVNAAGLFGDRVEAFARPPPFEIRPRKGQFAVFDKSAAEVLKTIVLPVPTSRTRGVIVTPTIFGNVMVGPTAEDQTDRERARVEESTLATLHRRAVEMIPALGAHAVTAGYAGLRPASGQDDYHIEVLTERRWITVAGIRSTGLTAALGIAEHVIDLHRRHFGAGWSGVALAEPAIIRMPNLAEHRSRPHHRAPPEEIVCACESVTRAEIVSALTGPLPATDMDGLKRRTRCLMGRCRGVDCRESIARLLRVGSG